MMPSSEYATIELPFGPNRSIYFRGRMVERRDPQMGIRFFCYRFDRRLTEVPLLVPNKMRHFGPAFNGCVVASCVILDQSFKQHLRYDDAQDIVVAPKQIAQRLAMNYGVDVNDMMQQYPHVRPFLAVEGVDVPLDIQTAIRNLSIKGEAAVHKEGL